MAEAGGLGSGTETGQIQSVVRLVKDVLGTGLLGAYLHGSMVLGGLRPTSDLDLLIVCERSLTSGERSTLMAGLLERSGVHARLGPARPIELSVVVAGDVKPWRYPPRQDFLYGEWLRDAYERGLVPEPEPAPDLAILITMARQGNTPLVGPPPDRLLDPVPHEDVLRAASAGVPQLLDDIDSDTRNVLLTLARIWTTLRTGEIRSKDAAASWALPRLPARHQPVLARARARYLDGVTGERWDDLDAARACAAQLTEEIRR